ncbi:lysophospholipid acyltransferase family protein [Sphingomonas edaphi]|uniref:1-acyl-sn-glycerol-3-phosphate acyltransferase n=1 Tax=Sphingomonas edaphi TaxID=2315689 RepID=A0A418PZY6_9SPHN|nr:1-acyl-sn-glycerol-3-phosphate acyltransferase [Sphingomonas edaphi]RIX29305.1 1-acyl-sn-glycerol-3-phosphate acyltransferase [Sphingomonas edaphi]
MTAKAEPAPSRLVAGLRIVGLAGLFLAYLPPHILSKLMLRRSRWPRRFLAAAARIAGARSRLSGEPLGPRTLVVANHTSWLDILVLGGATGTAFVSKAEVKATTLIGWLADQNRTLYIERSERGDAHGQVRRIRDALDHHQPLAIFPEGTTGHGRALMPFRSTLFHAVAPPPEGVSVRPVAIDYGHHVDHVGWHGGEGGLANAMRVLGRRGTMDVHVRLLDPLPRLDDRKALARHARDRLAEALSSVAPPSGL